MLDALAPLRRDVAKRAVLGRDSTLNAALAWGVFLGAEALAALAVSAAAAAALTSRWSRLRDGILRVRRGVPSEPFFHGADDEFGAVETELDELLAALGDRERTRSELRALQGWGEASAFLAHQARTPLASLSLSAMTARAALESCVARQEDDGKAELGAASLAIERAELEAGRLNALFSRMRSLSGFKDPELEDIDPAEALKESVTTLAARGRAIREEDVVIERSGLGPRPSFDRAYLVEAFTNLLNNSLEACGERGLTFGARLSLLSGQRSYTMEYVDSVTGLDPYIASRVGTARFTTKSDGAGLGVWLVGRVAALHGGRMKIDTTASRGLRFSMIFPVGGDAHG